MVGVQNKMIKQIILAFLGIAIVIGVWEFLVHYLSIRPQIFPAPSKIASTLHQYFNPLVSHSWITLKRAAAAFGIGITFGIVIALVLAATPIAHRMLQPLITSFYCLPKSVVVPIFLLWTGLGNGPAILTGFSLAFFPVLSNVFSGLKSMPTELVELCIVHGGKRRHVFWKIGLPTTLPFLLASFRAAGPGALVGVIIAEMMASSNGLGYVIVLSGSAFNVPLMFSAILILAGLGVVIYGLSAILERRFAHWAFR